ncbi:Ribonuclease H-like superfamily [Sesbania bispinosa]|nr:Ribonuclease H-like superfamily [Sesbania bispinosa]
MVSRQRRNLFASWTGFKSANDLGSVGNANASHTWKSILKALDFCRDGFEFHLASGQSSLWFSDWSRQGKLYNKVPFIHVSDLELQVRDIWDGSHWILEHLYTVLSEEVRNIILHSQGPSNSLLPDDWFWLGKVNGIFSVSSCYKWLVHRLRALPSEDYIWKKIYSHFLHPEASLRWSPPESDWFKINVDDSFILHTQLMGAGGLIQNSFGRWIRGFSSFEDVGDILLAELLAILRGLQVAHSLGLQFIVCESDSISAVDLISNHHLVDGGFYVEALSRIRAMQCYFAQVVFRTISRSINVPAGFLARMAFRHGFFFCQWREPSS